MNDNISNLLHLSGHQELIKASMSQLTDLSPFTVDDESPLALYQQIARWIQMNITAGKLSPEEKLPTVRGLAEWLGLNRGAVASAYSYLTQEGILTARVGRGTYINAHLEEETEGRRTSNHHKQFWDPILVNAANRIGLHIRANNGVSSNTIWIPDRGEAAEDQRHIPLDLPLADHALSQQPIQQAIHEIASTLDKKVLSYSHPQGTYDLRKSISQLARNKGIGAIPAEIMVVNGAQQAFALLISLLVQPGDNIITENPTYPGAIRAFRMARANIIGIPVDDEGMRVDVLEEVLQKNNASLIYTIPSFQAPTNSTLSADRRAYLYQLAKRYHVPIIEDEYVNDLYYDTPPPPPLKSIDEENLVIYVGTFSKTLGASIRLGWIAAHPDLIAQLIQIKEVHDIHSSIFSQLIVERLLHNGLYEGLLIKLRSHYGPRRDLMTKKLRDRLGITLPRQKYIGGFSLWARLPDTISATDWLAYARVRGVPFEDGSSYFLNPEHGNNYVKFCFSLLSLKDIDEATKILDQTLNELSSYRGGRRKKSESFLPFV